MGGREAVLVKSRARGRVKGRKLTGCEEVGRVEVPEDGEAVDEDEDRDPEHAVVREPRLELAVVDELFAVEALRLEAAVCSTAHAQSATHALAKHTEGTQNTRHAQKKM